MVSGILAVLLSGTVAPAAAASPGSEPVYDYAKAVRETVWVDIGRDGDGDGRSDRVAADIVRPSEATSRVPVIMDASPYYSCCGRGNESELKSYDSAGKPVKFPLFYDNYFVPRGYAVVLVDLAGTNRSAGCADVGGASDVDSARKVVDWLNGRATGYSAKTGGSAVTASWSTGNVGMIGKSYDGTIANGVAATGVAGLKTIVPISAISSWYDYYRSDGATFGFNPAGLAQTVEARNSGQNCSAQNQVLTQGATANGDYGPLWADRDYVRRAGTVRASVLLSHGVNDLNVKTIHFGQWWAGLNVEKKIWLSQTGHVDPFDYRRADWVDLLHRWFDHYLLGIGNGVQNGPQASVERQPDQWADQSAYPAAGAVATTLRPGVSGTLGTSPASGTASFTDNPGLGEDTWVTDPGSAALTYSTGSLASDLQVSGTTSLTVTATPSTSSARLSALLVDLGPATIRNFAGSGEGIKTGTSETCWGSSTSGDDACYRVATADAKKVSYTILSRGWADLANYASLSQERPLTPGTAYTMTFRLASTDHIVPRGHALALIIGGTDGSFIRGPAQPGRVTLDLARTSASVPLLGIPPAATTHPAPAVGEHVPSADRADLR
ncbi:X-Pro dipeptidyl-peptidase [Amycolatopsis mediterranei S699]|uniref:X-Pro dipeptidyl-peptidase n=2 Tax=Amycolatopsis mediterranei TaxID=33910 RepID=A0A0H3D9S1_AMYMU|nr:X-Pro dipeptidyl-peptidase [Amycolatopsis mediterranei U32]AEK44633.1 x-prolyl-dipeptidyl aminopeptidase [Amycolatopsis mediterranei S699]AGT86583.1 X-Pro dipeptidyl-peptidase [Amycolatopsis mediterranei RB]KDO11799.1 x-prolyl-dipeptidyl aminopeptidase [Amycolatopsis mediterranei]AFO79455.1 X-Pro dipeptidyl-peptidase [Amycolatopsis mediterranei S699]